MDKPSRRKILYDTWRKMQQEVVSPWLRRHRAKIFQAYVLIALLGFFVLAFLANTSPYLGIDLEFSRELQSETPLWFGYLLLAVSWLGYTIQSIVMISIVVITLGLLGLRWEALTLMLASIFCGALNYIIKLFIRRPRPSEDLVDVVQSLNSYSFPSGHPMFYVVFFGFLLFLVFTLLQRSWKRLLLGLLLLALIILVGPSRMYLGEHWASDVLGAYLMGSLTLILTLWFYQWGKSRFHFDQPVASEDNSSEDLSIRDEASRFHSPIPITSQKDASHEHHPDRPERK
jgi:undecaprenyl-diphosphatase